MELPGRFIWWLVHAQEGAALRPPCGSPEERNKLYKILKLRVVVGDDGTPEVTGVFCELELRDEDGVSETRNDVPASLSV